MVTDIETKKSRYVEFDREKLNDEIDVKTPGVGIFAILPNFITKRLYPQQYFGTERYPDWKL